MVEPDKPVDTSLIETFADASSSLEFSTQVIPVAVYAKKYTVKSNVAVMKTIKPEVRLIDLFLL